MARFVVLEHTQNGSRHFDLMLECGGALRTFSFARFPAANASCERLFDHRMRYLDFEGDIGRGKGAVRRVESGGCEMIEDSPTVVRVMLAGAMLRGAFVLSRTERGDWTFSRMISPVDEQM